MTQPIDENKKELAEKFNIDVNMPDEEFTKILMEKLEKQGIEMKVYKVNDFKPE